MQTPSTVVPLPLLAASAQQAPMAGGSDAIHFCLRCLKVALDLLHRQGAAEELDAHPMRRLLRELGVLDRDARRPLEADTVLTRLDARLAEIERLAYRSGNAVRALAEGLARAFGYDCATTDLLELAIHANRCRLLRNILNLFDDVEEEDAAEVFAEVLGHDREAVIDALHQDIPFRSSQPFDFGSMRGMSLFSYLAFNRAAVRALRGELSTDAMLSMFFRKVAAARLSVEDFAHQGTEVEMLLQYLRAAMASGRRGANVLVYGAPGTGKTELVRVLGEALVANLVEVPSDEEDQSPLSPRRRLTALRVAQEVLRGQDSALVLFDEVEDVFPVEDGFDGLLRGPRRGDRNKAWLTRMLEDNPRPTFWVCNRIAQIDPAYLRRFDFVMELAVPPSEARERIIERAFASTGLGPEWLRALGGDKALAPAHLERMGDVLRMLQPTCETSAGAMFGILERNTRRALGLSPAKPADSTVGLPYRPECVNADVDMALLADSIAETPAARLCLFGPPGTGKTAWARQLAERIGRPLHVQRASDLLGKYVGESERLVRRAFERAESEGAVLLLDEADSLLQDRSRAQRSWEVTLVNEMLTSMETFDGVFIASTNLQGSLDAASARRFDFKVKFGYMKPRHVQTLYSDLLVSFGLESSEADRQALSALRALVPGDFANVHRQARVMSVYRNPARLVELLTSEQSSRRGAIIHKMGFV